MNVHGYDSFHAAFMFPHSMIPAELHPLHLMGLFLIVKLSNLGPGWLGVAHPRFCFGCGFLQNNTSKKKLNLSFRTVNKSLYGKNGSN